MAAKKTQAQPSKAQPKEDKPAKVVEQGTVKEGVNAYGEALAAVYDPDEDTDD
jgi:hypothetical protein